ncbi:MAG: AEC family transporter [Prolixibacteraceae bacterium]|nr:AEC family transporter [Prolixibacteraceae bacterium]
MYEIFSEAFSTMLGAVGRIFLVIVAAGFLVRRKILLEEHVTALSWVTVNVLLPCMMFSKISANFQADTLSFWWFIPLTSAAMIFAGVAFGYLFYLRRYREKQFLIPLASMQNAVYLVLPIGLFMYPDQFDEFATYNFLFLIGFTVVVWSLGKVLITGASFRKIGYKDFVTPPLVASTGTLLLVLLGLHRFVPAMVMDAVDLVGDATIPVSNLVLGATLGGISFKVLPKIADVVKLTVIKYMLLPLTVILVLHSIGLKDTRPLLADMLVIESAAAPATALILQVRAYGGDRQTIGSNMIVSYAICLLAIPFWIAVWQLF